MPRHISPTGQDHSDTDEHFACKSHRHVCSDAKGILLLQNFQPLVMWHAQKHTFVQISGGWCTESLCPSNINNIMTAVKNTCKPNPALLWQLLIISLFTFFSWQVLVIRCQIKNRSRPFICTHQGKQYSMYTVSGFFIKKLYVIHHAATIWTCSITNRAKQ